MLEPSVQTLQSLEDTKNFAEHIASNLKPGDVVALQGDLGVGKTTLSQFIIKYLFGAETNVTSPTFNIVNIYLSSSYTLHHYDLYRIEDVEELDHIGIEESFEKAITLIEWPEIAEGIMPSRYYKITLEEIDGNRVCNLAVVSH